MAAGLLHQNKQAKPETAWGLDRSKDLSPLMRESIPAKNSCYDTSFLNILIFTALKYFSLREIKIVYSILLILLRTSAGPRDTTVGDFWRMVWQEKITQIVMLTNTIERGQVCIVCVCAFLFHACASVCMSTCICLWLCVYICTH